MKSILTLLFSIPPTLVDPPFYIFLPRRLESTPASRDSNEIFEIQRRYHNRLRLDASSLLRKTIERNLLPAVFRDVSINNIFIVF